MITLLAALTIGGTGTPPTNFDTCPLPSVVSGYTGPTDRCGFPLVATPGPLPIAGATGAWVWSCKIRRRIRESNDG